MPLLETVEERQMLIRGDSAQWTQPCKPELSPEEYLRLLRIEVCQHGNVCCLRDGTPCGDYWKPSSGGFEDEKLDERPGAGGAGAKASE